MRRAEAAEGRAAARLEQLEGELQAVTGQLEAAQHQAARFAKQEKRFEDNLAIHCDETKCLMAEKENLQQTIENTNVEFSLLEREFKDFKKEAAKEKISMKKEAEESGAAEGGRQGAQGQGGGGREAAEGGQGQGQNLHG
ncbi:MAG: hypothetical protein GY830_01765 [Bacteroidetes bacterium]|nr:hypothetical protein [Bacteroidota bacterium]